MHHWDLFISHASEDKSEVVLPLATLLQRAGLRVWLDRQELRLGDSLREKIDEGLANSRFGIVILSQHFLEKKWPKKELNGLFSLEDANGSKVIIPVWHGVTQQEVAMFSPILSDRIAGNTTAGLSQLATEITKVVTIPGSGAPDDLAPTSLRLLVRALDGGADRGKLAALLEAHPDLLLSEFSDVADYSANEKVGPFSIDFLITQIRYTTHEASSTLIRLLAGGDTLIEGSDLSDAMRDAIDEIRALRRWIGRNPEEARKSSPGTRRSLRAIVIGGRRQSLSDGEIMALRWLSDTLPGITIRTYDWLIDSAASRAGRRHRGGNQ